MAINSNRRQTSSRSDSTTTTSHRLHKRSHISVRVRTDRRSAKTTVPIHLRFREHEPVSTHKYAKKKISEIRILKGRNGVQLIGVYIRFSDTKFCSPVNRVTITKNRYVR